ncbi:MAG: histidine ammonia-lyase [Elusimicrobia bacterium]|nr:histidine ammonia-lyase [Elusimicrobiota bacterium]
MSAKHFELGGPASIWDLNEIAGTQKKVKLTEKTKTKLALRRAQLEEISDGEKAIYGINTGFGELASVKIPKEKMRELQLNLIRSHACGAGEAFCGGEVRCMMFLRANELARGYCGVRPVVVETLAELINKDVIPYVPSRGSVGASGDLSPLAHIALVLIGEGKARVKNSDWMPGGKALELAKIKPLVLHEKEGLSLTNGTQAMQSVGGLALIDAWTVHGATLCAGAMSVDALKASDGPFSHKLNGLKPQRMQIHTAEMLREMLEDSEIRKSHLNNDPRVQDAYSLRCMPQVLGAVASAVDYAITTVELEMFSATDNPLLVGEKVVSVISGGNFHGQALSLSFDFACAAMTSLGNMTERRIFHLISDPTKTLPPFLAKNPGAESGWMIAQYLAAALASENKTLAHPASADSISTCANKEDFVSMGMWAAIKLGKVVENCATLTAIELLAAAQAVECHKPLKPGQGVRTAIEKVRAIIPKIEGDTSLTEPIEKIKQAVLDGVFVP